MGSLNPGANGLVISNSTAFSFGASNFGGNNTAGQVSFNQPVYFTNSNSTNAIGLKAPAAPSNYNLTLAPNSPPYATNVLAFDSNNNGTWFNAQFNSITYQPTNNATKQNINNVAKLSGFATTDNSGMYTVLLTKDGTSNTSNIFTTITDIPKPTAFLTSNMTQPSMYPEIATQWYPNDKTIVFKSYIPGGNLAGLGSTIVGGGPGLAQSNVFFSWNVEFTPANGS